MFTKIMINSNDSEQDRADLARCASSLMEAKQGLVAVKAGVQADWKGNAASQYISLLDGFSGQIDKAIARAEKARKMLLNIEVTYREADAAVVRNW